MAYHADGQLTARLAADIGGLLAVLRQTTPDAVDRLELLRLDTGPTGDPQPLALGVWHGDDLAADATPPGELGLDLTAAGPYLVEDAASLSDADTPLKEWLDYLHAASFAAFPLPRPGEDPASAGFLHLYRQSPHTFSDQEIATWQALCPLLGFLLENTRLVETDAMPGEQLAVLNHLLPKIAGMLDLEAIGREVAAGVRRLLPYEHLSLALVDEGRDTASLHVLSADEEEQAGSRMFPLAETAILAALDDGQKMIVPDLSTSPHKDLLAWHAEGMRGAVLIPLVAHNQTLGTLNVGFSADGALLPGHVELLEQLATHLAASLDNMRRMQLERDRHVEARTQLEIAQTICSTLDLKELLRRICLLTAQLCAVDRCTILLLDADDGQLWPVMSLFAPAYHGPAQWEDLSVAGSIEPEAAPVFQQAIHNLEPVVVADVTEENLLPPAWAEEFGIQRLLSVPLVSHDQAIGVIALDYTRPEGRFSRAQVDLAVTIGGQVGIGVENARFVDEMQQSLAQTMTLFNASAGINQARDVADLLETVAVEVAHLCRPDHVHVYMAGPDPRVKVSYLEQVVDWQVTEETTAIYHPAEHREMADVPPLDAFPSSRLNVVVNDLPNNRLLPEPTRRALLLKGVYSLAMVPLVSAGTWLGAILLERSGQDAFDEGTIALCRSLVDQAALALDNLLQLEFARRSAAREHVLRDISTRLNQAPDVESVLQVAVEELGKALGVREGSARLGGLADEERSGDG